MRRYTGSLTVELEDINSGAVQTVQESNMVTNAVNDLLGTNPMGLFYKASGQYDLMMEWNDAMLPICPNMIGGIMLYPSALTEQASNIYPPSSNLPVGYASNDVNATGNLKRGSMNLVESLALSNGYKFVWEFTPSQGNGTIAAVGLTSKQGGANVYGSDTGVDTTILQIRKNALSMTVDWLNTLFRAVQVDFENGLLYSEWSRKGRLSHRLVFERAPFYVANMTELKSLSKHQHMELFNHQTSMQSETVRKRLQIIAKHKDYDKAKEELKAKGLESQKRNYTVLDPLGQSQTVCTMPDDFIHYSACRPMSVREMARLQSFDDSFVFQGKRQTGGNNRQKEIPQYTLVGNAVPPLMARAIANTILENIK